MSLNNMKRYNRVRKLDISPLGYDGKLPILKKSAWSKEAPRETGIGNGTKSSLPRSVKRDVTAPSKVIWNGRRLNGSMAPPRNNLLKKQLFASQKIPKSWVLPGFKSTW